MPRFWTFTAAAPLVILGGCGGSDAPPRATDPEAYACADGGTPVMLDVAGPGRRTALEAAAITDGTQLIRRTTSEGTEVVVITADGRVDRIVSVSHHQDGWWPDSYLQCSPHPG